MTFKNKTILITNNRLQQYAGSEIVTLELAKFFQKAGAKVIVFAWFFGEPIKSEFEKAKISITNDDYDPILKQIDIAWIHHQVIPLKIIENLNSPELDKTLFLFNHMSALDIIYLEQPYIYDLEKKLASASLFVSEETQTFLLKKYGDVFPEKFFFPNPSPEEFISFANPTTTPKKILIVSNHPPEEVLKAVPLLEKQGYTVDIIGEYSSNFQLATPKLLKQYNIVITIGKTVQYCLNLGIPVYIYDHFAGPGYLNAKNFNQAKSVNFSGRGTTPKTPKIIYQELIKNYSKAFEFQQKNHQQFIDMFSLPKAIEVIFKNLKPKSKDFSRPYLNYVATTETIIKQKILNELNLAPTLQTINSLQKTNAEQEAKITELSTTIKNLETTMESMENSRAVKLAKFIRHLGRQSPKK